MTTYRTIPGSQTLTISDIKPFVSGTTSLFRVSGPILIHQIYSILTTEIPSAAVFFKIQHSSSFIGPTDLCVEAGTSFNVLPVGTYLVFPTNVGVSAGWNNSVNNFSSPTPFAIADGVIEFVDNEGTAAAKWFISWTALHATSSVTAL